MSYTFSPEEVKELTFLIVNSHMSLDFLQVQHLILGFFVNHKHSVDFQINARFLPKSRIMKSYQSCQQLILFLAIQLCFVAGEISSSNLYECMNLLQD